jgi:hypothetical protein
MGRPTFLLVLAFTFLGPAMLSTPSAIAGANRGGSAFLSWDRSGDQTVLSPPPTSQFPLYLQLRNVPDVQTLAVCIRWSPFDSSDSCYKLISADPDVIGSPDSLPGWATNEPPGGTFEGDSSYTWTIQFPPTTQVKRCVKYSVTGCNRPTPTDASFALPSVIVKDSGGLVDTLAITGSASITSVAIKVPTLRIDAVAPSRIVAGRRTWLDVTGSQFGPGTLVSLQGGGSTFPAIHVEVYDAWDLVAQVEVPTATSTPLDVVVQSPAGGTALLSGAMTVVAPSVASAAGIPKFTKPTNASHAHTPVGLDSAIAYKNVSHPERHYEWPASLSDSTLLAIRQSPHGPDSIAIIRSLPYSYLEFIGSSCGSWVRYAVDPPIYATSIALLATGELLFDGPPTDFQDRGKQVLSALCSFEDGTTTSMTLSAGAQIRNWRSGMFPCNDGGVEKDANYLVSQPTDTVTTQLYGGPGQGVDYNVYYDVQRFRLPVEKESLKVQTVQLNASYIPHPCNATMLCDLCGIAIWPEFVIQDQHGNVVQRQSQLNGTWRYHPYGGYTFGNYGPIGTRRTIGWSGCSITSIAMGFSFYGHSCTPDDINTYLQTYNGYKQQDVAEIVSVVGNTVWFRGTAFRSNDWAPSPVFPNMHDRFLVEHKVNGTFLHHPVATIEIDRKTEEYGIGHIVQSYPGYGSVGVGDLGFYYFERIVPRVNDITSGRVTLNYMRKDSRRAARAESLMVRGRLLTATTHNKSSGLHWVVLDGWQPAFISADTARGTYHLADPAYGNTRLIQEPFGNEFSETMYFMDNTAHLSPELAAGTGSGGAGGSGLSISIGGHSVVQVVDPLGRVTSLDPETGEYVSDLPLILTLRGWTDDDEVDDPADVSDGVDVFEIPEAVDGQYLVTAAGSDVSLSANSYDASGVLGADHVVDTTAVGSGCVYGVTYSAATGQVQVQKLGVAEVGKDRGRNGRTDFRVLGNPGRQGVRLAIALGAQASVRVAIYDVAGRVVGEVPCGELSAGEHVVSWSAGGRDVKPGVYFAVLDAGGLSRVARFVLLR